MKRDLLAFVFVLLGTGLLFWGTVSVWRMGEVVRSTETRRISRELATAQAALHRFVEDRLFLLEARVEGRAAGALVADGDLSSERWKSAFPWPRGHHEVRVMAPETAGSSEPTGEKRMATDLRKHLMRISRTGRAGVALVADELGQGRWLFGVPVRQEGRTVLVGVVTPFSVVEVLGEGEPGLWRRVRFEGKRFGESPVDPEGWIRREALTTGGFAVDIGIRKQTVAGLIRMMASPIAGIATGAVLIGLVFGFLGVRRFVRPYGILAQRLEEVQQRLDRARERGERHESELRQLGERTRMLQESEARMQAMVATAPVGILTLSADGRIQSANPVMEALFGHGADGLVGAYLSLLMAEREWKRFGGRSGGMGIDMMAMVGGGQEVAGVRKDGSDLPMHLVVGHVRFESQEWFTAIISDQSLARSNESDRRFKAFALEHASDAIMWFDEGGMVAYANAAAMGLLGYGEGDFLGSNLFDFVSGFHADRWPHQWEQLVQAGGGMFRTSLIPRNGRRIPVDLTLRVLEYEGMRYGFLNARDISERIRQEAALRKLSFVASRTDNAVIITDTESRVEWVNDGFTRMTGFSLAEVRGQAPAYLLNGPETDPETIGRIRTALAEEIPFSGELPGYRKDGSPFWLQLALNPVFDDARRLVCYIAIESDVTERKAQEAELEDARRRAESASRTKSEFLAGMSHEIRTPLNTMIGMSDLLRETRLDSDQQRYVDLFEASGNALLSLINDILDVSKIEAGHLELENIPFDVRTLAREIEEMFRFRVAEKGLHLDTVCPPDVPGAVMGDPARIRQVLVNLVGNAIKFTDSGGVTLMIRKTGPHTSPLLSVSVADTGIGISEEKLSQIFEPFTQADASMNRRFGGTGLGLTISRRLVGLMDGEIRAESRPGKGSTFSFDIPLVEGELPEREEDSGAEPIRLPSARILLVDDFPDNRFVIRSYLKESGVFIQEVENGREALAAAFREDWDLVLMDMQMPEMDGLSALRALRAKEAEEGRKRTPILMVTAHALESEERICREAGADAYLTKPLKKKRLLEALRQHLGVERERFGTKGDPAALEKLEARVRKAMSILDAEIVARAPLFLSRRMADFHRLTRALEAGDFAECQRIAHDFKGLGGSYGFEDLSEAGAAVETASRSEDRAVLAPVVDALGLLLERLVALFPDGESIDT